MRLHGRDLTTGHSFSSCEYYYRILTKSPQWPCQESDHRQICNTPTMRSGTQLNDYCIGAEAVRLFFFVQLRCGNSRLCRINHHDK